jgi:hypothetical protein
MVRSKVEIEFVIDMDGTELFKKNKQKQYMRAIWIHEYGTDCAILYLILISGLNGDISRATPLFS